MAPHWPDVNNIYLESGDSNVPYRFAFSTCSTASLNDGMIPYGATISTVTVTGHTESGTATNGFIATYSYSASVETVKLSYPGTAGTYHMKFAVKMSGSATKNFKFNRVIARDS